MRVVSCGTLEVTETSERDRGVTSELKKSGFGVYDDDYIDDLREKNSVMHNLIVKMLKEWPDDLSGAALDARDFINKMESGV